MTYDLPLSEASLTDHSRLGIISLQNQAAKFARYAVRGLEHAANLDRDRCPSMAADYRLDACTWQEIAAERAAIACEGLIALINSK